jgi:lipopolysaccharide export system protein LptA
LQVRTLYQLRSPRHVSWRPALLNALPQRRRCLTVIAALSLLAVTSPDPGVAQSRQANASVAATSAPTSPAPSRPVATPDGGLVTIESDSQQADNRTGVVTAIGNVRIEYPDRHMVATARQAQYFSREGKLVLTGDVDVIDADGQRIRAERLVYRLDSERLLAEPIGGKQVYSRLRLQPKAPGLEVKPLLP